MNRRKFLAFLGLAPALPIVAKMPAAVAAPSIAAEMSAVNALPNVYGAGSWVDFAITREQARTLFGSDLMMDAVGRIVNCLGLDVRVTNVFSYADKPDEMFIGGYAINYDDYSWDEAAVIHPNRPKP